MTKNISGDMSGYAEAYAEKEIDQVIDEYKITQDELDLMRMQLIHCHGQCRDLAQMIHRSEKNKAAYDYFITVNSVTDLLSKI